MALEKGHGCTRHSVLQCQPWTFKVNVDVYLTAKSVRFPNEMSQLFASPLEEVALHFKREER